MLPSQFVLVLFSDFRAAIWRRPRGATGGNANVGEWRIGNYLAARDRW